MLDKFRNLFRRKETATASAMIGWFSGGRQPIWTPADYANLAREGYAQNVFTYRCVEYLGAACAGIEWCLYKNYRTSKRKKEEEEHPLLDLLWRPNERQAGGEFFHSLIAYRLLSGNAYIERVGPGSEGLGAPKELYALRPDLMTVLAGDRMHPIAGYCFKDNGKEIKWTGAKRNAILHWKTFNPLNHWYGQSPLEAAARSLDQNNESRKWNVGLLQNSARPSGALLFDTELTDQQRDDIYRDIDAKFMGARGAGRIMVSSGGKAQWVEMGMSPVDMAWLDGLRLSSREICTAFGIPPELVGDSQNKTYSNYQEARKAFYEESVLPMMDSLRDALNGWLTPLFGDRLYLDYNRDDIEALQEDRDKLWMRLEKVSFITDNEKREAAGYEAYTGEGSEEADKLRKPVQTAPIDATSTFENVEGEDDEADEDAKGMAWDRVIAAAKARVISISEARRVLDFDVADEPKEPAPQPQPAPVINVTSPDVRVSNPPIEINLTLPSGTKKIHRDEEGRITAIEEHAGDAS